MIQTVTVRGVTIGEGIPKICVPIVGVTEEEIREEARRIVSLGPDLVEWRADWFAGSEEPERVQSVLRELRAGLGEIPLLFTFRTRGEGGERALDAPSYVRLNWMAAESGCVDLLDAELYTGDEAVREILDQAHRFGVRVVASNHDFAGTPEKEEILRRLRRMQELGADILKIAVMPNCPADVLTLLAATEEMNRRYADRPVVTMSMGGCGAVSRVSGEVFGSAVTFGSAGKASAPGQVPVEELRRILGVLRPGL